MSDIDPHRCPLCGGPNACGCRSSQPCWCAEETFPAGLLAKVPVEARRRACICRSCVEAYGSVSDKRSPPTT